MKKTSTNDGDVARIERLLTREHALLVGGDFDGLANLVTEKQALHASMVAKGVAIKGESAQRLRRKAEENRSLLAAAAEGLRSGLNRVRDLRALAAGGGTYAPGGRRTDAPSAASPRVLGRL